MKFGLVIGSCAKHFAQVEAYANAEQYSEPQTRLLAVLQGVEIDGGLSPRWEIERCSRAIGQEQGLWCRALAWAIGHRLDYVAILHDDMSIRESGWEQRVRSYTSTHRVGVAAWCVWPHFEGTESGGALEQPFGAVVDGCGVVFNVHLFRQRGTITDLDVVCGHGDVEASLYATYARYGVLSMGLRSHHFGNVARSIMKWRSDGWNDTEQKYRAMGIVSVNSRDENSVAVNRQSPTEYVLDLRRGTFAQLVTGTDKESAHGYGTHYDIEVFARLSRDADLRVFEIGVSGGGSLRTWERMCPRARIVGLDIDPSCVQAQSRQATVCIGHQGDADLLRRLSSEHGPFQLIVDDGSHTRGDQAASFATLWPLLDPGGVYVVEDIMGDEPIDFLASAPYVAYPSRTPGQRIAFCFKE